MTILACLLYHRQSTIVLLVFEFFFPLFPLLIEFFQCKAGLRKRARANGEVIDRKKINSTLASFFRSTRSNAKSGGSGARGKEGKRGRGNRGGKRGRGNRRRPQNE